MSAQRGHSASFAGSMLGTAQCSAQIHLQHTNKHLKGCHLLLSLNAENFPPHRLFPILRIRAGRLCEECQKNRGSRAEDQNCSKASNSHPRILIHGKHRITKQQIKPPLHPSKTIDPNQDPNPTLILTNQ